MSTSPKKRSSARHGARVSSASGVRAKPRRPRVLVVDDVRDNRELYAEFLAYRGFEVTTATDGADALRSVAEHPPDAIVMDLALPVLDGWEATRQLKSNRATRHIPIVVVTGHVEPAHQRRAIEVGCDLFLPKPHLPEDVERAILGLIDRGVRRRLSRRAGASGR